VPHDLVYLAVIELVGRFRFHFRHEWQIQLLLQDEVKIVRRIPGYMLHNNMQYIICNITCSKMWYFYEICFPKMEIFDQHGNRGQISKFGSNFIIKKIVKITFYHGLTPT